MRNAWGRLIAAWVRFWSESAASDAGLLELVVNLAYAGRLRSPEIARIVVLVDSRRQALLLRLLRLAALIPWCRVRVVHRAADLDGLVEPDTGRSLLLVATAQLFLKRHQAVAALRRQSSVVVI